MKPQSDITRIEPVSIRVNFFHASNTVTLAKFSTTRDPGWEIINLPADYLVRVIAPAVKAHLREIRNQPASPKDGGAP